MSTRAWAQEGGVAVHRCLRCSGLSTLRLGGRPGSALSLLVLVESLRRLPGAPSAPESQLTGRCSCPSHPVAEGLLYGKHFPNPNLDFQIVCGTVDGQTQLEAFRMEASGKHRWLGPEPTEELVRKEFGCVFSVPGLWASLLSGAQQDRARVADVEHGYYLGAIGPQVSGAGQEKAVADLVLPLPLAQRPRVFLLRDLEEEGFPYSRGTYHDWAAEWEEVILRGRLTGVGAIDAAQVTRAMQRILKRRGIAFRSLFGVAVWVRSDGYELPLGREGEWARRAFHLGLTLGEACAQLVDQAQARLAAMNALGKQVSSLLPRITWRLDRTPAVAYEPGTTRYFYFDLLRTAMLATREPEFLPGWARYVESFLLDRPGEAGRCPCGRPAALALKLRPSGELEEMMSPDQRAEVLPLAKVEAPCCWLPSMDCGLHTTYIGAHHLESWGMTAEHLAEAEKANRASQTITLAYEQERYLGRDLVLLIVGRDAASLGADAGLVSGLLAAADIGFGTDRVSFTVATQDAALVHWPQISQVALALAVRAAAEIAEEEAGAAAPFLPYTCSVDVRTPPVGHFSLQPLSKL